MSVGPTERLIRRARDWAGDVEELSSLQWRLLQLEFSELTSQLRGSVWLFAASIAIGTFGAPLAIVAGLVMLAQAMEWPIANVLAAAGVLLVVLATALWFDPSSGVDGRNRENRRAAKGTVFVLSWSNK